MPQSTETPTAVVMQERTHVGRVRTNNEDALCTLPGAGLAILADGMGGLVAGEVASRIAVEVVRDVLLRRKAVHANVLARAIRQADRRIQLCTLERGEEGIMGTTIVVWQRQAPGRALVAHVGDSRCYREHAGRLVQLTRDHSVVQQQVDAGLLAPEQAQTASYRHLITQALGLGEPMVVDVVETPAVAGDRFLLCSDGLTDMLDAQQLAVLFRTHPEDGVLADRLVEAALAAGGRDNISLVLVRL